MSAETQDGAEAGIVTVREIMSGRPITVGEGARDVRRLMTAGAVRHVPVVAGGRLRGIWVLDPDGPLVLLGPERVHETGPDATAAAALDALAAGAEAVLVWEHGVPSGLLTREDLASLIREALARGIGRRRPRAAVVRVGGPRGAGVTTLLARSLALLGRLEAVVVEGDAGLAEAGVARAASQLVLVEDRDAPGPDEADARVAVIPAPALAGLEAADARGVDALVVTRADEARADEIEHALRALRAAVPGLHTFAVAAGRDERGLAAWCHWLECQALPQRG